MEKSKIILSDLHLGAGSFEQGNALEDFTGDEILAAFLERLVAESQAEGRELELIFAGDTFEFLQVPALEPAEPFLPTLHYPPERYRSSAEEPSRRKMAAIIAGHPQVFAALQAFIQPTFPRRTISFIKGNHDVNLHWRKVQDAICQAIGALDERADCVSFVERRIAREGIYVEHGNQYADRLSHFPDFEEPHAVDAPDELYLPAGARLAIELLNDIEWQHYWMDGVKPLTALIWYTFVFDFDLAVRMLRALLQAAPLLLGPGPSAEAEAEEVGALPRRVLEELDDEKHLRVVRRDPTLREGFFRRVAQAMGAYGSSSSLAEEEEAFEVGGPWRRRLLERGLAQERAQSAALTDFARLRYAQEQVRVVVFGHSHEACSVPLGEGAVYINTGTWTWQRDFAGESYSAWRKLFRRPELFTNRCTLTYARINYDAEGQPEGQLRELEVERPPQESSWQRLWSWLRPRR